MTKRNLLIAGLLAIVGISAGVYSLRPTPEVHPAAVRFFDAPADPAFEAFVTSDSLIIRPRDGSGGYSLISSIASGNDVQTVGLFGPTASGTLPLTFGGQTSAGISFSAATPARFAVWQDLPVTSGTATEIAFAVVPSPGFYTADLLFEVIEAGVVKATATLNLGAVADPGDFQLANPAGGSPHDFAVVFPSYTPASPSISVRISSGEPLGLFWDADAVSVKVGTGSRTAYDDGDAGRFSFDEESSGGPDGRFWGGTYTRFQGGHGRGMAYAFDAPDAAAKLQALSSIGTGNVSCTASAGQLRVEFVGTLGAVEQPAITSPSPSASFPEGGHLAGGSVPSVTVTPQGGTPGSPISLRKAWIFAAGQMSGAVYPLAPDSIPASASSTYSLTVPDGWIASAAGSLPGATATASNRVGGSCLPAFAESAKTLRAGFNVLADVYYSEGIQFLDMAAKVTNLPLGSVQFGGSLALDENLYPTWISPAGAQVIVTEPPTTSPAGSLGPLNAPNGLYTFICTDPGHAWITPGGDFLTGTGVSAVEAHPDTTVGDVRTIVRNVQCDRSKSRSPKLVFNWNPSGPQGTFNGQDAFPCTVTNIKIYPPDTEADPTGMTPWANPTGKFHPAFLRKLAGVKTIRVDQAMFWPDPANSYADFADIRKDSQIGRGDSTRVPVVGVASCRQYTGAPLDAPDFLTILVETVAPHTLSSGMRIDLLGCGHATFSDGNGFDIGPSGLGYGVITVLTDTTFVWHAGQSLSGQSGVTMMNTTAGGTVRSTIGTGWAISDAVDICNAVGADLWFNVAINATDECIDAIADRIAATLDPGLKVRPELGDETWNSRMFTYSWARVRGFQLFGETDKGTVGSTAHDQNNLSSRFAARFALAGRPDDVVFVMPSMASDVGRTTSLLAYCAAHSYRVDEVAIAPYVSNMPLAPMVDLASASSMPLGIQEDIADIWVDSNTTTGVAAHKAAIAASAFPSAGLVAYEGGQEEELVGMSLGNNDNTTAYPDLFRDQYAMHRNPRKYRRLLNHLQHLQDDGLTLWNRFYLIGSGGPEAYSSYEWFDARPGTGSPDENPDPSDTSSVLSQEGGAVNHWNSLLSTSPILTVTPSSASATDASTTVSITATLANSAAGLAASVSGGGTISTASPASGTPFTYTPPASGSGTATVTVSDATDGLSRTCVITYSPAGITPAPTPIRIDRIRPFRRVRPAA